MPQIHCYIPKEVSARLQEKAEQQHLSISKYLAKLIQQDIASDWPDGYFELFGSWEGEKLQRPEQGDFEQRETLQ